MKVLSLFDGMACGALALMKAGITIESYDAFEIDDYAVRTALHNFPFVKQHGDVFKADFSQFKGVDLLCGGSPCTYWSIAQKNNRSDGCKGKTLVAETVRVGALPRPNGELSTSQAFRVYSTEGKSVNLTAGGGGAGGKTGLYAIPCKLDEHGTVIKAVSCADGKTYTVYEVKDGRITIKGKQYPIKLVDGCYIIRKLSVRECMRLQTVPEWYEFPVSDSQAYKMLGNGWTVEVIAHILASLK